MSNYQAQYRAALRRYRRQVRRYRPRRRLSPGEMAAAAGLVLVLGAGAGTATAVHAHHHASPSSAVQAVITYARAEIGKPYAWGGTGPDAFDCSGLVMMAYRADGIGIPRTSQQQWAWGPRIQPGHELPGDLVFFAGSDGTPTAPGHVGLVIGHHKMIQAYETGTDIMVSTYGQPTSLGGLQHVVGFTRPTAHAGVNLATGANRALGLRMAADAGLNTQQRRCLDWLWTRESGWRPRVWNSGGSGAYGIPQALPASRMATAGADWRTNPATQIRWGLGYIKGRYTTACSAWAHETTDGWY